MSSVEAATMIPTDGIPKPGTYQGDTSALIQNQQNINEMCSTSTHTTGDNFDYGTVRAHDDTMEGASVVFDGGSMSCLRPLPDTDAKMSKSDTRDVPIEPQPPAYNKRALTKTATTYKLELFKKNLLIIFNQINIAGFEPRTGTQEDVRELRTVFAEYGFEAEVYDDRTKAEIFKILDNHDYTDFTDYGAIAVVILTHGTYGGALIAQHKRDIFSELEILERLSTTRKPTLVTKPKLVFIQACRGYESTRGVAVLPASGIAMDHQESKLPYHLPIEADTLVFHSSFVGKPSFRPADGSWFIQTLCQKIHEHAHTSDLLTICTEVQREVACNKYYKLDARKVQRGNRYGEVEYHVQMPTITSNLIRKVYLKRRDPLMLDESIIERTLDTVDNPIRHTAPNLNSSIEKKKRDVEDDNGAILDHLDYMKDCLRHYIEENPYDTDAQYLLEAAVTAVEEGDRQPKLTLIAVSNFLENKLQNTDYAKYVHFYGANMNAFLKEHSIIGNDKRKSVMSLRPVSRGRGPSISSRLMQSHYAVGAVVGLGAYVVGGIASALFKQVRG